MAINYSPDYKSRDITFDTIRDLKHDDTQRFGQWLYNLILDAFNPTISGYFDSCVAVADKLYNISDDDLLKLVNSGRGEQ